MAEGTGHRTPSAALADRDSQKQIWSVTRRALIMILGAIDKVYPDLASTNPERITTYSKQQQ